MTASVTLGGVPLAATGSIAWRLQAGVAPFQAVYSVRNDVWDDSLSRRIGQPLELKITDDRGVETVIKGVFILHEAPSGKPSLTSFVVADRRWKWAYKLIVRDYNTRRPTGDRTVKDETLPFALQGEVTVPEYDYRKSSLDGTETWTSKRALEDILQQLEPDRFTIRELPTSDDDPIELRDVLLRDRGDVALAKLLQRIPGSAVYIDQDDRVIVFDASDLNAADDFAETLQPLTWKGDKIEEIDRKKIRPSEVHVFFQREVEVLLRYEDDYTGATQASPVPTEPYIENVVQTVDLETTVREYDAEAGTFVEKTVPPGTWVNFQAWLNYCNENRPTDPNGGIVGLPWTFDTIKKFWISGDLDAALGGTRDFAILEEADVSLQLRVEALKTHFRQSFRINRRYMERVREIQPFRAGILDPINGARQPAAVWGQACIIPTEKGKVIAARRQPERSALFINIDNNPKPGDSVNDTRQSSAKLTFIDADLGIFRLDWRAPPFGTVESFVPCNTADASNRPTTPSRNLAQQDDDIMGSQMRVQGSQNSLQLRETLDFLVMVTMVPSAPNNRRQFHREVVKASDISNLFRTEFRIQDGEGPVLEVLVPPSGAGQTSARYAWDDDQRADTTVARLFGLFTDDPNEAGIPEDEELDGFVFINQTRDIQELAKAIAAEQIAAFADSIQGTSVTPAPQGGKLELRGNVRSATVQVSGAPQATVMVVHEFPGQQQVIDRLAFLPDAARQFIQGTLPSRRDS